MILSELSKTIKPSSTLAITAKAKLLKSQGKEVVSFGAGEPDFDTPLHIKNAAIQALNSGDTKYTPAAGSLALKNAVIDKFKKENNLDFNPENIIINCGAKHSLFNLIMCTIDKNDEVIIPTPYWVSYPEMVKAAGGKCVFADCLNEPGYKLTPTLLKKLIGKKTKLLILNSPSNPTGALYSKTELQHIADIILSNDIFVISDEIYEHLVYDAEFCSIANISTEMKERTLIVNGVSKAYSMTGWRIGYAAGNAEIISACSRLQAHSTSNPTSFAQAGAVTALNDPISTLEISKMRNEFKNRRDYIFERLNSISGISVEKPNGAFYIFPNISKYFSDKIPSSHIFSMKLLDEKLVALVPGEGFGAPGFIRLSYAASIDDIKTGIDRLEEFLVSIKTF